jgi:NAD(P)-dependent dehydrogenase (short-subunit alcohol dehydrogenase family)
MPHHEEEDFVAERWEVDDIPDLTGRVAIVTGANSGIGLETSRELARNGAWLVLACRDSTRGEAAARDIVTGVPGAQVEILPLDLACLDSIRRFTQAFAGHFDRLDLLVNNGGVMVAPYGKTEDGFEQHFGVNHLGHFALTGQLIELVLATPGSRVVTVTSAASRYQSLDFDNLMFAGGHGYSPFRAYARSKLANLQFTRELNRRLAGSDSIAVAAHPGGAATGLGRRMGERPLYRAILPVLAWMSQSAAGAARSVLRAATDPDAVGGQLYGPGGLLGMKGAPVVMPLSSRPEDKLAARRLWEISEQLTDVHYP